MVLEGYAKMVGVRSGTKDNRKWCSVVLDAVDDPIERVEYFVPNELIDKVEKLSPGDVRVVVRVYPMRDRAFGSRLVDINTPDKKDKNSGGFYGAGFDII